jgi:hypothetical protein
MINSNPKQIPPNISQKYHVRVVATHPRPTMASNKLNNPKHIPANPGNMSRMMANIVMSIALDRFSIKVLLPALVVQSSSILHRGHASN